MTNDAITEGRLVKVDARTWPGINKPGGVGRVIRRRENVVDVQYVLGGGEKGVPLQYVSIVEELTPQNSLRDRSVLLGRCKNCGSLRTDCGSCDLQILSYQQTESGDKRVRITSNESAGRVLPLLSQDSKLQEQRSESLRTKTDYQQIFDSSDDDSNSSIDDHLLAVFQTNNKLRRNLSILNRLERDTRPKGRNPSKLRIHQFDRSDELDHSEPSTPRNESNRPDIEMSDDETSEELSYSRKSVHPSMEPETTTTIDEQLDFLRHHRDGELLVDNDLEGFIQPEGAATTAPRDTEDKTVHLSFVALPIFFEETMNRVSAALPEARAAMINIVRRVEMRKAVGGQISDLEEEGWRLYDETKHDLLLGGLDQCRFIFKRMNSRKEFRIHEGTMSRRQRKQFGATARSMRDILFDQADKNVEDLLRELRQYLLNDSKISMEDELFGDVDSEDSQSSQEPLPEFHHDDQIGRESASGPLPRFDPHVHAKRLHIDGCSGKSRLDRRKRRKGVSHVHAVRGLRDGNIVNRSTGSALPHPKRRGVTTNDKSCNSSGGSSDVVRPKFVKSETDNKARDVSASDPSDRDKPVETRSSVRSNSEMMSPNILKTSNLLKSDDVGLFGHEVQRRTRDRISISDRMQSFLDANLERTSTSSNPDSASNPQHRRRKKDVTALPRASSPQNDIGPPSIPNLEQEIFRKFRNIESTADRRERENANISNPLKTLRLCCLIRPSTEEILRSLDQNTETLSLISRDDAVSIFSQVHSYLTMNPESLQELISTENPNLSQQLQILEAVLMLLKLGFQGQIKEDDGTIFNIFAGNQPCPFVHMVILQLLDVLYGLFNPHAWAMKCDFQRTVMLEALSSLRNALSRLVPLTEVSCHFLLHFVESQRWWKSRDGSRFVSSVNPVIYRSFLKAGEIPTPVDVRLQKFNSLLPRVETHAIWSIIGFMASSHTCISAPTSKYRWQLVYTILCGATGVLPKALEVYERSRPSPAHVERCEIELGYLTLLISRGNMMPLDGTDKIVETILRRSILLESKHSCSDTYLFRLEQADFSREGVLTQWDASSLYSKANTLEPDSVVCKRYFLLPGLLQKVVDLLASWTRQTKTKPVLWKQLATTISKLQDLEDPRRLSKADKGTFADAFKVRDCHGDVFVRTAVVAVMSAFDLLCCECKMPTKKPYISVDALSRVWFLLSDSQMILRRKELLGEIVQSQSGCRSESPLILYFSAIRTFCMYLLAHIEEPISIVEGTTASIHRGIGNPRSNASAQQYLVYEALCSIIASLDCMCTSILALRDNHTNTEPTIKALSLSFTWISRITDICRNLLTRDKCRNSIEHRCNELQIVGSSILTLCSKTFKKCMLAALSMSKHSGGHACFRLCISTIRSVVGWAAVARTESQTRNDEFDDLDDLALLGMGTQANEVETAADSLSRAIMDLLVLAESSKCYSIDRSVPFGQDVVEIDSHQRIMLSHFSGGLCACLASLVAAGSNNCVKTYIRNGGLGRSVNSTFKSYVAFALLTETCALARNFSPCVQFVEQVFQTSLITILKMVLDADSLERFPTCDLQIMMDTAGNQGARRERRSLNLAFGKSISDVDAVIGSGAEVDEIGPSLVCCNLWKCTQDLLTVVKLENFSSPLSCLFGLTECEVEPHAPDCAHSNSLEMECLRRMKFLLNFFKIGATSPVLPILEDTLVLAIRSAISNLLKISDGLLYHKLKRRTSSMDLGPPLTRAHGKLLVLQTCFVEVFVVLMISVVLSNWYHFSDAFRHLLSDLREVLVFSMYDALQYNVEGCFHQFLDHPEQSDKSSAPRLDLRRCIKHACIRRSREIIRYHLSVAPSTDRQRGAIALVAGSIFFANESSSYCEYILDVITEGFRTDAVPTFLKSPGLHLFQEFVDEFIYSQQASTPMCSHLGIPEELSCIRGLRAYVLTQVIPSKLRNRSQNVDSSMTLVLGLANRLLYLEIDDRKASTGMNAEFVPELYELLHSSWDLICECVQRGSDSSALLSAILRCISLVCALPTIGSVGEPNQPLLGWARAFMKEAIDGNSKISDKTPLELFACYFSTLAMLIFHIATFLSEPNSIAETRANLTLKADDHSIREDSIRIPTPSQDDFSIQSLISQTEALNNAIRCENKENRNVPRNGYLKKTSIIGCGISLSTSREMSLDVKHEARNLIAIIEGCPLTGE